MIQKDYLKGSVNVDKTKNESNKRKFDGSHKNVENTVIGKSFVSVVKTSRMPIDKESPPAIVLEDDCLNAKDLTLSLMGRVKEMASLVNLKKALCNEGFDVVKISYLGELWVLLEFETAKAKDSFRGNVGVGSWFSVIKQAYAEFVPEGRLVWVELDGVPFKFWSGPTFKRIAAKWGELLDVDDYDESNLHSKRICILSKDNNDGRINDLEANNGIDESDVEEVTEEDHSLSHPPGFTPEEGLNEGNTVNLDMKDYGENERDDNSFINLEDGKDNSGVGIDLMIVVVYAPQEAKEKRMLWDYLAHVSNQWVGKLVMMGDFNEVRYKSDRYGSNFNAHDAEIFNSFIYNAGLDEVPLGGSAYTWYDYGLIPFRFYRYWLELMVLTRWSNSRGEIYFLKEELRSCDEVIDKGDCSNEVVHKRTEILNKIHQDFRPISLIGSLYKIIAKILANRLVGVLGDLVNEVQSAFVADRQILDGPFILDEVLQWCRRKKKHALIFKVDFEKAFDSVRWDFVDDVLNKFGFGERYAGLFTGIKINSMVNLSHLFYADDAIFLGQWSELNIDSLVRVLDCFFRASGLRINMCKSKIMGVNVEDGMVKNAASKLGCLVLKKPFIIWIRRVTKLMGYLWGGRNLKKGCFGGVDLSGTSIVSEVRCYKGRGIIVADYYPIEAEEWVNTGFGVDIGM
ncbi:nucleotide-binding alpha-beta plait domain-containing protein [Tanacetum coccineum]